MSKNSKLYIIDLDRTLVDVEKAMELTEVICSGLGVDFSKIYQQQKDLQSRGTSYSPFSYIASHSGSSTSDFEKRFIELSDDEKLLFDDAKDLLKIIKQNNLDFVVLTHGSEEEWQLLKLKATGLDKYPFVITNDRYKSRIISSWIDEQGMINPKIDGLREYTSGVFIDDRQEAFVDFPKQCQGYLLDRFDRIDKSFGRPSNVKIVKSLSQVPIS